MNWLSEWGPTASPILPCALQRSILLFVLVVEILCTVFSLRVAPARHQRPVDEVNFSYEDGKSYSEVVSRSVNNPGDRYLSAKTTCWSRSFSGTVLARAKHNNAPAFLRIYFQRAIQLRR